MDLYRKRVETVASTINDRIGGASPETALILGSGLGELAREVQDPISISYGELPGFPSSTAPGHSGTLHIGRLGSQTVLVFEGRFHIYEGYDPLDIAMPTRVAARLGVQNFLVTNAAGGINLDLQLGDLLILEDHINLMGANPLTGANIDDWGPRFPDMSSPYCPVQRRRLLEIAQEEQIGARSGVYAAVAGPNLETPAEYRMLRTLGADVVGMSTVPEAIVAAHEGLKMTGISVVTDLCDPENLQPVSVEEILKVAGTAEPKLTKMVVRLLEE
ncbi:MAG TPA: purine-nucleoside phosphorylase [Planctomycetes bacterium]|nr:purine-nucleoside phosphorylase [Planctomycetota bacterium]HIN80189.1 purine-nucleoside phosphorylase [Planctomycetota bacterium]